MSAVYLLAFLVYVLAYVAVVQQTWTYDSLRAWLRSPAMQVAVLLCFAALLVHLWIGVRDVILDYVKPVAVRSTLLGLLAIGEGALAVWVLVIMLA